MTSQFLLRKPQQHQTTRFRTANPFKIGTPGYEPPRKGTFTLNTTNIASNTYSFSTRKEPKPKTTNTPFTFNKPSLSQTFNRARKYPFKDTKDLNPPKRLKTESNLDKMLAYYWSCIPIKQV